MKRPTPIYTDRLEAALRHFGIPSNLKRSTLTEIIARTFGYRNTNDMAALISRDHTPPMAQIHPAADLITLLDPETSEPFGISKALISAASLRKNQFILAPSGTLLDISALTKQAERPSTLDNLAISLPGFDPDNQVPARLEDNEKSLTIRFDLGPWLKQLSPFPDPANEEFTEILDARLTEIITPDLAADYKDMADLIESVELKTGKDNPIWLRYDEDDVLNWLRNNQPETYAVAVECELCTPLYTDDKGETIPAISIGDWIAMIRRDPSYTHSFSALLARITDAINASENPAQILSWYPTQTPDALRTGGAFNAENSTATDLIRLSTIAGQLASPTHATSVAEAELSDSRTHIAEIAVALAFRYFN